MPGTILGGECPEEKYGPCLQIVYNLEEKNMSEINTVDPAVALIKI